MQELGSRIDLVSAATTQSAALTGCVTSNRPCASREGSWAIAHTAQRGALRTVQRRHECGVGPVATYVRCPVIVEGLELHPDCQCRIFDIDGARLPPGPLQLSGMCHRSTKDALPECLTPRTECGSSIAEQSVHRHATSGVPHRGGHNTAGTGHPMQLSDRKNRIWNEVQHELGETSVEPRPHLGAHW